MAAIVILATCLIPGAAISPNWTAKPTDAIAPEKSAQKPSIGSEPQSPPSEFSNCSVFSFFTFSLFLFLLIPKWELK